MRFVDTNVLPYAVSRDPAEQDKAKTANDILAERDVALSVQVLQGTPRSSRPPARWVARTSCPRTSATARTMAASGSPIRSAEKPGSRSDVQDLGVDDMRTAGLVSFPVWQKSAIRSILLPWH